MRILLIEDDTEISGMDVMQEIRKTSTVPIIILSAKDTDSDEKVMFFTDNQILMELLGQINRLLLDRQRKTANFRHLEASSKKMLSNISHDIKTPMTVVPGYLEILRLHSPEDAALIKAENKAKQVMDLINQFLTLAKLEAGDMEAPAEAA